MRSLMLCINNINNIITFYFFIVMPLAWKVRRYNEEVYNIANL